MIKKVLFLLILFTPITLISFAQDFQLHFTPGHAFHSDVVSRNFLRGTVEYTKVDPWGSTYMFVDLYFNQKSGNMGEAYTEIHRDFKIKNFFLMPHVEYDGGVLKNNDKGYSIESAYFLGVAYEKTFSGIYINTYLAYRYNAFERSSHDMQWTVSWNTDLFHKKVTVSGFVDVWSENENKMKTQGPKGKRIVLYSKPQFWYNFTSHASMGTEIEISNNFYRNYKNRPYITPTIAAKWNF